MKKITLTLAICILFSSISFVNAQSSYARIIKNNNAQAKGLYHDLNATKDTLILKSDRKINYLYSIDKSQHKDLNLLVNANSYKLPLNRLSKGKHVFVAIQSPLRIVFVVHMLEEIPTLKKVTDITEESITEEDLTRVDNH